MYAKILTHLLHDKDYRYRIIENDGTHASFLIHKKDLFCIDKIISSIGYMQKKHPFSKENGYNYTYQLTEFLLYQKQNIQIELYCELPCASLTPKTFIPLDKSIQNEAWRSYHTIDNMRYLPNNVNFLYNITQSIFLHKFFDEEKKLYINDNIDLLSDKSLILMLEKVFFKFTSQLTILLKQQQFDSIVNSYLKFTNY